MRTLTPEEQEKYYAKYYALDLKAPAWGLKDLIMRGPMPVENMILIENRDQVLTCDVSPERIGYGYAPDGSGYVSTYTYMPEVTKDMIDWWFAWHGLESARYVIWDKEDHYSVETTKADRLTDESIPMNERIWGVTHKVLEDTGCGPEEIVINFLDPSTVFSKEALESSDLATIVCGNGSTALMCHTIFNAPDAPGILLCSHFWIGYNVVDHKLARVIPEEVKLPEQVLRGLALHSIKEYSNMGQFLPYLYAETVEHKKVSLIPHMV